MRKLATMFLLMVSFTLVFAGAVAAAPNVDVKVIKNGTPVTKTSPGDKVNVTANATTDVDLNDPAVLISVNPKSGLKFKDTEAVMTYDGKVYKNNPEDPFFYWSDQYNAWVWWIGWVNDQTYIQYAGEDAQLIVPAIVSDVGKITVNADYMKWDPDADEPELVAADSYTFLSIAPKPVNSQTVPMQNTGAPLAVAALGLVSIIGGTIYGKLR